MAFISEFERGSLRIESMIIHVVSAGDFRPETESDITFPDFFIDRIRNTDSDAVYSFRHESQTKRQLERIFTGEDSFEVGSQSLSREFHRFHGPTSKEGAFFIFKLRTNSPNVTLFSLIKYDYSEVIEQTERAGDGGGLLRQILRAFITEKKAIQKAAIVRIVNGQAEAALSVMDRLKPGPDISDYFARFLDVSRTRSDAELNNDLVEVLRLTLSDCKDHLPDRRIPGPLAIAKSALRDRQEINEDAIIEALWAAAGNPDDEAVRTVLATTARRKMRTKRIEGLTFRPNAQILRRPPTRKVRTSEGVILQYPESLTGAVVVREVQARGGEIITITTAEVTEDDIISEKSR